MAYAVVWENMTASDGSNVVRLQRNAVKASIATDIRIKKVGESLSGLNSIPLFVISKV